MSESRGKDKAKGMKSAYEETKRAIAEARRVTESKLAELEILHRDKLAKLADPVKRAEQEEFYRLEKERLTADGEAKVAKLRTG